MADEPDFESLYLEQVAENKHLQEKLNASDRELNLLLNGVEKMPFSKADFLCAHFINNGIPKMSFYNAQYSVDIMSKVYDSIEKEISQKENNGN